MLFKSQDWIKIFNFPAQFHDTDPTFSFLANGKQFIALFLKMQCTTHWHRNYMWVFYKSRFLGPSPGLWNHKLQVGAQGLCSFQSSPCDFNAQQSLRTTYLQGIWPLFLDYYLDYYILVELISTLKTKILRNKLLFAKYSNRPVKNRIFTYFYQPQGKHRCTQELEALFQKSFCFFLSKQVSFTFQRGCWNLGTNVSCPRQLLDFPLSKIFSQINLMEFPIQLISQEDYQKTKHQANVASLTRMEKPKTMFTQRGLLAGTRVTE